MFWSPVNLVNNPSAIFCSRVDKDMTVKFFVCRIRKCASLCFQSNNLADKVNAFLSLLHYYQMDLRCIS